jgi:hypothetical protein
MPSAIDVLLSQPALRVFSEPCPQPFDRGRRTPVLHGQLPLWRWLGTLSQRTESAMDRLDREEPYRFVQTQWW